MGYNWHDLPPHTNPCVNKCMPSIYDFEETVIVICSLV